MKTLKITFSKVLIFLSAVILLNSCKKNKDVDMDGKNFDITQHYITGSYLSDGITSSYVYGFKTLAKAYTIFYAGLGVDASDYKYENGVLNIDGVIFNISNGAIKSSNDARFKSYNLQKIPTTDAFANKTFKRTIATNGVDVGKSCVIKFTNGKFMLSIDGLAQLGTGAEYTLQNNGVATANTGLEGSLHLMSIVDNKMYYSHLNGSNQKHDYSVLTQQ